MLSIATEEPSDSAGLAVSFAVGAVVVAQPPDGSANAYTAPPPAAPGAPTTIVLPPAAIA